jgi:hypothetical protein
VYVCTRARARARTHTHTNTHGRVRALALAHTQERSSADWRLKKEKGESNEMAEAEWGERAWQVQDENVFGRSQSNLSRIRLSISILPVRNVVYILLQVYVVVTLDDPK